jgi:predicted RNA-binding Zn-ribbon protein involved in translation (DUF1610 family)
MLPKKGGWRMSRDWTPEETRAASEAMKRAGQMSYEEVVAEATKQMIEQFSEIQREGHFPCPRCGHYRMDADPIRNALSRRADVQVCDQCGVEEALEDLSGARMPLTMWNIAQEPEAYRMVRN